MQAVGTRLKMRNGFISIGSCRSVLAERVAIVDSNHPNTAQNIFAIKSIAGLTPYTFQTASAL
ncbi:hypothetical protein GCM10027051_34160 [Niabella terrae]